MFPSTAKENGPSSASSSSMPSVVPDNNNNINEDNAKKTRKEIRDETIRLIQTYLDEQDGSVNEARRAILKKLHNKKNVDAVTDESFLKLKKYLNDHQSKAEKAITKLQLEKANLKVIKASFDEKISERQQLVKPNTNIAPEDEPRLRVLIAEITELKKKRATLNNNIIRLDEDSIALEIVKYGIKVYFPTGPSYKGQLGVLPKDLLHLVLRKTNIQTVLSVTQCNSFFSTGIKEAKKIKGIKEYNPLITSLKKEAKVRDNFEDLVGFLPHRKIRDEKPERSKDLIKKKVKAAKVLLTNYPMAKTSLLYKTGPLTQRGLPPLYLAATRANKAMWEMLLSYLPEENHELHSEIAHLQWAVTNVDLNKVRDLISINPDLLITQSPLTRWDCTPLFIAARQHNEDTHKILMKHAPEGIPESVKQASECLYFVSGGQQAQAEELVKENPGLITQAGIDGHSPLQMAASLGDMHMLRMLKSNLKDKDKQTAILQLEEVDKNSWRFNPKPFLAAYQTYANNFDEWYEAKDWSALRAAWQKIGWELRLAPQHVVAEFCQDHPLSPTPDFKEPTLKRDIKVYNFGAYHKEDLFPLISDSGLGFDFHIIRSVARVASRGGADGCHGPATFRFGPARSDFLAMKALFKVRRDEYQKIKQVLKDPERELQDNSQHSSGCCIC